MGAHALRGAPSTSPPPGPPASPASPHGLPLGAPARLHQRPPALPRGALHPTAARPVSVSDPMFSLSTSSLPSSCDPLDRSAVTRRLPSWPSVLLRHRHPLAPQLADLASAAPCGSGQESSSPSLPPVPLCSVSTLGAMVFLIVVRVPPSGGLTPFPSFT